jgi:undecaprenyl diphosphate synthase
VSLVDVSRLPAHVAIVMDGNGRWAQLHGLPRTEGHRAGSESVRRVVRACRRLGVSALTLYAFSEQNWGRPLSEVQALMDLLHEFLLSERQQLLDNAIRLRGIGRIERLPDRVAQVLRSIERDTSCGRAMTLSLALSYGGREEIADGARALAERVARGDLRPEQIDEALLESVLPSMDVGPVDLLVRPGGEQRISNFLLWGSAYAELYFSPKLWPDWQEADLFEAIAAFQRRDRRFGHLSSDVASPGESVAVSDAADRGARSPATAAEFAAKAPSRPPGAAAAVTSPVGIGGAAAAAAVAGVR